MRIRSTWVVSGFYLAAAAVASAGTTGEFNNMCTEGLAMGQQVHTSCDVNMKLHGKTYCFSDQAAKHQFMKDPKANLAKAEANYSKLDSKN